MGLARWIRIKGTPHNQMAYERIFIILGLATFAAYMMYGISQTNPDINYKHYDAIEFGGK